jgi:hypothetical protein
MGIKGGFMEMITAVALFYCRIWPCQALIVAAGAGAAAGAVAGYFAAQSVVKQYAAKIGG